MRGGCLACCEPPVADGGSRGGHGCNNSPPACSSTPGPDLHLTALEDKPPTLSDAGLDPSACLNFLNGGGALGELMRSHDWSRTPLGQPAQWPDALRATVEVMLTVREPRFIVWGPARTLVYNDGYAPLCGSKHPWALGKPCAQVWAGTPEDMGPVLDRCYAGETVHMDDVRFTMQDRHGYPAESHFSFSYVPIHDREGCVAGVVCICAETTGKIFTERLLAFQLQLGDRLRLLTDPDAVKRLASELLATQLQISQVGYAELDRANVPARITAAFSGERGAEREGRRETIAGSPRLLAELSAERAVVIHDVQQPGHPFHEDIAAFCAGQGIRALALVPLVKHDSLVAYLFLAHNEPRRWALQEIELAQDVAERVWAAVERTSAEHQLRQTRERLASTLEAANIATWDYDIVNDRVLPDLNMAALFGVPDEEVNAGMSLESFLRGSHDDDRDRVRASFRAACATGSDWQAEYRIAPPAGGYRWIIARARIERDGTGRATHMPGVLVDITDRKSAEEALREADRRKDEFLATLAHELRNPLAPIRSAARISSDPAATMQQLRWSHEVIERQVRHMALLLDDLLDVSRITRGILEVRREWIGLPVIVEAALETARPLMEARRHTLEVDLGDVPIRVLADPLRMAQALSNLLTNAAKYTDPHGRILLIARLSNGMLELRVRDNGIGLPRDALQRIFNMFSQVESALDRSEGGLGIGLALVKGLVELHGGTVDASSAGPGQGSEFVLRIPDAQRVELAEAPAAEAPEAPELATTRRIVLADDNEDGATTLASLLELDGHEVRVAYDGPAALELVQRYQPEVAFLDIGMPGLNGYEVARRLREDAGDGPRPVLVALTGWGGAEDRKRALQAGFDHHLTKPVDPDAITAILTHMPAPGRPSPL